nr:insulinase family protein [Candidatus Synchoanobacter obligatus]
MLIVQDPAARESAAAMYVGVGSQDDPPGIEGLAHFLEHMLFIGTEEYPEVDALSHYVSDHGGGYNAFTSRDHTQYFFSVQPQFFSEGFNIFSSFFVSPLFDEGYVERERHAVHAEFKMHQKEDPWRHYAVSQLISNPNHPANRFHVGNLDTLKECREGDLRKSLLAFYHKYYSSNNMYFVAVTPDTIETHLDTIKQRLLSIPNRNTVKKDLGKRFDKTSLGRFIQVENIAPNRSLDFEFAIPNQDKEYFSPAASYISSLIGDEGEGSILEALKREGWAQSLSAGYGKVSDHEGTINVEIELTEKGYHHIHEIISAVMSYVELIRYEGVTQTRFNEAQRISFLEYLFYGQQPVLSQVNGLVASMPNTPYRLLRKARYITDESVFDKAHIYQLLDAIRLDNARIWLSSPDEETNEVDDVYHVEYSNRPIGMLEAVRWLEPSNFALALPKENSFIPNSISIHKADPMPLPVEISSGKWYLTDSDFLQPKQYMDIALLGKEIVSTKDIVAMDMGVLLLRHLANPVLYPANNAGLNWSVSRHLHGLNISVWGMGDQSQAVLQTILKMLGEMPQITSDAMFHLLKERYEQALKEEDTILPAAMLSKRLNTILRPDLAHREDRLEVLDALTLQDVVSFLQDYFAETSMKQMYYGNLTVDSIQNISPETEGMKVGKQYLDVKPNRVLKLEKGIARYAYPSEQSDHAVILYYQMPGNSYRERAMTMILNKMIAPDFFEELRTNQQLGYFVRSAYRPIHDWPGMAFLIQSPHTDSATLIDRIHAFLEAGEFWHDSSYETAKATLIHQYEDPFETMGEVSDFYWYKIWQGTEEFDSKQKMIQALEDLTYSEIKAFYQHTFVDEVSAIYLTSK